MTHHLDRLLTSAAKGQELAEYVTMCLEHSEMVTLDFGGVEVITPSFANAFVMTLLHRMPLEEVRRRCVMVNRAEWVAARISDAARRYQSGVRLSSQMQTA